MLHGMIITVDKILIYSGKLKRSDRLNPVYIYTSPDRTKEEQASNRKLVGEMKEKKRKQTGIKLSLYSKQLSEWIGN
jgi:hypothetical protein